MPNYLSQDLLCKMHAYWRAANYLSVGQIYLQDNPLLESPLTLEHIQRTGLIRAQTRPMLGADCWANRRRQRCNSVI
jgi:phosphoketolase